MDVHVALDERSYSVRFGELGALAASTPGVTRRPALLAVDEHVHACHGERIATAFAGASVFLVPRGERAKTPETYHAVCRAALDAGVERGGQIIAVGGGVTCDVVGFAAATYHRGIDWVAVPTTVLAMVDASVGGKTGVNLTGAKNAIGAFHQPSSVLVDVSVLTSLERREVRAGLVEALKIGVVRDVSHVEMIEASLDALLDLDEQAMQAVIRSSVALKSAIVAADERESGGRALLNFGHTVGHALEAATGFGRWLHGEAVAIGMVAALRLSHRLVGLGADGAARVESCLARIGVPVADPETPWASVEAHLVRDKKAVGGRPAFVLTPRIGSGTFGHLIPQDVVAKEVAGLFGDAG